MRLYAAFVVVFLFSTPIAHAEDNQYSRPSLRGLKVVHVVIEDLPSEVELNGLTTSAMRTDVELKLRQAGIPVMGPGTFPWLYVSVDIHPSSDGLLPYMITVEVRQATTLIRDPSILVPFATTWGVGSYGTVGVNNVRTLRDTVKDKVDMFINAYFVVNPKK